MKLTGAPESINARTTSSDGEDARRGGIAALASICGVRGFGDGARDRNNSSETSSEEVTEDGRSETVEMSERSVSIAWAVSLTAILVLDGLSHTRLCVANREREGNVGDLAFCGGTPDFFDAGSTELARWDDRCTRASVLVGRLCEEALVISWWLDTTNAAQI